MWFALKHNSNWKHIIIQGFCLKTFPIQKQFLIQCFLSNSKSKPISKSRFISNAHSNSKPILIQSFHSRKQSNAKQILVQCFHLKTIIIQKPFSNSMFSI